MSLTANLTSSGYVVGLPVWDLPYPDNKHIGAPKYTDQVGFGDSICTKVGIGTGVTDADMHMTKIANACQAMGITPRGEGINGGTFPQYLRSFSVTTPLTASTILCGHSGFNVITGNAVSPGGRSPKLMRDMDKLTEAMLLWMSISEDKKVRLRDPLTGAQINSSAGVQIANNGGSIGSFTSLATNFARNSSGTGSTLTFTLTGTHLYLWYGRGAGNGGTFTVSVDGGPAQAINSTLAYSPGGSAESGAFAMDVVKFEGLEDTTHTLVVTVTASANVFHAAAGLNPHTSIGPTVLLGSCLYTATYGNVSQATTAAAAGTAQAWLVDEQAIDAQNAMTQRVIDRMRRNGYLVYYVDNTSDYNTETEISGDNIHPLAGRHNRIFSNYMGYIRRFQAMRS